jgi:hypothetical protein
MSNNKKAAKPVAKPAVPSKTTKGQPAKKGDKPKKGSK